MKKSLKIILSLTVLVMTIFTINVQALSWDSIKSDADKFISAGEKQQLIKSNDIVQKVVPVGQMLTALGVAVLFGALLILGIKYMKAQPEERGKLKQQLVGLVLSGIVIFGAYTIWNIAYKFFKDIF